MRAGKVTSAKRSEMPQAHRPIAADCGGKVARSGRIGPIQSEGTELPQALRYCHHVQLETNAQGMLRDQ